MGWGRTLLLGDIGNRMDIADTEQDIERLRSELHSQRSANQSLEGQVHYLWNENAELKLYLAGLMRLLLSKNVIDKSELEQFINLVDAEDGSSDGKFSGEMM